MDKGQRKKLIVIAVIALIVTNILTFCLTTGANVALGNKVILNVDSTDMADGLKILVSLIGHIDK